MEAGKMAVEGDMEDFIPDIDLKIVSREKWGALTPTSKESLPLPGQRAFFMFTDTERCSSKKDCVKALQDLQKHYMGVGMPDLPFSFLIGGDLRIYEGRGWGVKISRSDIDNWNDERVVFGYICPQKLADDRTDNMIKKAYQLMYHGIENNYLEDFDKEHRMVNVDDETQILKEYYEDQERAKKSRERKETRRKAREAEQKNAKEEGKDEEEEVKQDTTSDGDTDIKSKREHRKNEYEEMEIEVK